MPFIEGFTIGVGMIIFIGPVFFLLLNSSLQFGSKQGVAVALGIIFSDILCVFLCHYGLSTFVSAEQNQFWIGGIGSLILFGLGISYLIKNNNDDTNVTIHSRGVHTFFLKGFSVNFFNPFVFVVWIGVYNYGEHKYPTIESLLIFIGSVLAGILTTDLLKVFLSKRIRKFILLKRLIVFFKITGILLILFSFRLLYLVW
ncbi:LysE family translocator [Aquimarina sediminis]|uniref:LysE family translocator n=1 Tax=Aquimarina sediminis TaxID=2070536 RepID=UPI000CA047DB|nr:LysE family transporter [Aquimarina sediminis]